MFVYQHNHRTAGGSFNSALLKQFPGQEVFFDPNEHAEDFMPTDIPVGTKAATTFRSIAKLTKEPGDVWITSLRDPVVRVVDMFNFFLLPDPVRGGGHSTLEYATPSEVYSKAHSVDMLEYDNGIVRRLAGVYVPFGMVTAEHLELAKANLAKFDEVLFQESFDIDYARVASKYGWSVAPDLWNAPSADIRPVSFYAKHIPLLAEANKWDIALVEHAQALWGRGA